MGLAGCTGSRATGYARRRRAVCRRQEKGRPAEPGGLAQTSTMYQGTQVGNLKLLMAVCQLKVPLTERYSVVYHIVQSSESRLRLE